MRAGQLIDDLRKVQRVAAGGVIPRKGERADGVEQIAAGAVDVAGQKRNGDGHSVSYSVINVKYGKAAGFTINYMH